MENKKKEANLVSCSACNGTGEIGRQICKNCHGLGVGLTVAEKMIYFSLPVSMASIYLRRLKQAVFYAMDMTAYFFGVAGLGLFGWWFYDNFIMTQPDITGISGTFLHHDWRLLLFFISGAVDLFLIYRTRRKIENQIKITQADYLGAVSWGEPLEFATAWQTKKKINAAEFVDDELLACLEKAYLKSLAWDQGETRPIHVFAAMLGESKQASQWLTRLQLNGEDLFAKLMRQVKVESVTEGQADFAKGIKEACILGYAIAASEEKEAVKPMDILVPLVDTDEVLAEVLYDVGVNRDKIINLAEWYGIDERVKKNKKTFAHLARFKPGNNMDRAYTALATPLLDSVSYDLTVAAKYNHLDICVERDQEINEIMATMASGQAGILLVGPEGVGKKTIVGGLAQLMVMEKVPAAFQDKRLIEVDIARLVGGANPAEAEQRMISVINEIGQAGNVIVYLPNVENILGLSAGSGGASLDLSEILVNALERGWLYCIATTTDSNYQKFVEASPIGRALGRIKIKEPEINEAIRITESKVASLEGRYGCYLAYESVEQAVRLTSRYQHEVNLPDKAIKILDKTVAKVVANRGRSLVSGDDVAEIISSEVGVPVSKFNSDEGKQLLELESKMHERMVGQVEAVNLVAAALRRARAELREGKRPIASFLFLGPTGVGKTELAKTLASVYFGADTAMTRLDMSEYQADNAVEKMIGSPAGIQGYLTEKVRQAPFTLVLLDEIEKANPRVLDLFLQVMDDGRLTDGQGRTVDFTNAIVIATSNVGAVDIMKAVESGNDLENLKERIIADDLTKAMRPEFINRFDGIVVFKPLSMDEVAQIAGLMIGQLAKLLDAKGIKLVAEEAGLSKLAKLGYKPEFGARPLRRLLQDRIENVIANKILGGEIGRRDTVVIDSDANINVIKAKAL